MRFKGLIYYDPKQRVLNCACNLESFVGGKFAGNLLKKLYRNHFRLVALLSSGTSTNMDETKLFMIYSNYANNLMDLTMLELFIPAMCSPFNSKHNHPCSLQFLSNV